MSVKSKPFFWIECDEPGCDTRCPGKYDEVAAWSDENSAHEHALEADWTQGGFISWGCPDHPRCESCGDSAGELAGERDYLCPQCWERERNRASEAVSR